jgi:hypothetical protein
MGMIQIRHNKWDYSFTQTDTYWFKGKLSSRKLLAVNPVNAKDSNQPNRSSVQVRWILRR